jgi:hypothetical protein
MHFFAVSPRFNVCPPRSGGLELLADWQDADFACLRVSGWHLTMPLSRVPIIGRFLKNELIRKFQKSIKNQRVDSNRCVCKVIFRVMKKGHADCRMVRSDWTCVPRRKGGPMS